MKLPSRLSLPVSVLLLGLAVAGAGCGDDDESSGAESSSPKPTAVAIEVTGSGKNVKLSAPKTVKAGVASITFRNSSDGPHSLQLVSVDGDNDIQAGIAAGGAWAEGQEPLPEWAHTEGGLPFIPPGASATATQELVPGRYAAIDTESDEDAPPMATFEVTGEPAEGDLPATDGTVVMKEYTFEANGLKTGRQRVLVDNQGSEPHFLLAAPIKEGKTIEDVRESVQAEEGEEGEPPFDEEGAVGTAVMDGGRSQVVELDLKKPGEYALLCFVPDRKGGPPHAVKGMVSSTTVR